MAQSFPTRLPMKRGKNKSRMTAGETAKPIMTGQKTPFLLCRSPATTGIRPMQEVADGREEWHGASALSCEICRGITAFGRYYHDPLATVRRTVVPAARRLAASFFRYRFTTISRTFLWHTKKILQNSSLTKRSLLYGVTRWWSPRSRNRNFPKSELPQNDAA